MNPRLCISKITEHQYLISLTVNGCVAPTAGPSVRTRPRCLPCFSAEGTRAPGASAPSFSQVSHLCMDQRVGGSTVSCGGSQCVGCGVISTFFINLWHGCACALEAPRCPVEGASVLGVISDFFHFCHSCACALEAQCSVSIR